MFRRNLSPFPISPAGPIGSHEHFGAPVTVAVGAVLGAIDANKWSRHWQLCVVPGNKGDHERARVAAYVWKSECAV